MGESIDGSNNRAPFDLKKHDIKVVIIDEIMLLKHEELVKIKKWKETRRDVLMVCTGDPRQLEAIDDIIDNERKLEYVQKLFPQRTIRFTENKRLESDRDREQMAAMEADLWQCKSKEDVRNLVYKHFSKQIVKSKSQLKELGIKSGVTYYNESSKVLNDTIHSFTDYGGAESCVIVITAADEEKGITEVTGSAHCSATRKYYKGMQLTCKGTIKGLAVQSSGNSESATGILHTNYKYTISDFAANSFILQDILTEERYTVPHTLIASKFILPYCNTVHSAQGASIPHKFIIADWKAFGVTLNWLYTAMSRAVRFSDIYFLEESMYGEHVEGIIKDMISGYKSQDRKAGAERAVWQEGEYVTSKWIRGLFAKSSTCRCCGNKMAFEKRNKHKVTVNRLDNKLPHVTSNCELVCNVCNCSMK